MATTASTIDKQNVGGMEKVVYGTVTTDDGSGTLTLPMRAVRSISFGGVGDNDRDGAVTFAGGVVTYASIGVAKHQFVAWGN